MFQCVCIIFRGLNLVLCLVTKLLKLKLNKISRLNIHWIIVE